MPLSNYEVVSAANTVTGTGVVTVSAPSGKKVLGGGFDANGALGVPPDSYPSSDGSAWNVRFVVGSAQVSVTVYAVCAST